MRAAALSLLAPSTGSLPAPGKGTGGTASEHRERAARASTATLPTHGVFLLLAFTHGAEHPGMVVRMLGSAKGCQSQPCGNHSLQGRRKRAPVRKPAPRCVSAHVGTNPGAAAPTRWVDAAHVARHSVGLQQRCLPHRHPPPPPPLPRSCTERPGRAC